MASGYESTEPEKNIKKWLNKFAAVIIGLGHDLNKPVVPSQSLITPQHEIEINIKKKKNQPTQLTVVIMGGVPRLQHEANKMATNLGVFLAFLLSKSHRNQVLVRIS